jgi:hypothetical protein
VTYALSFSLLCANAVLRVRCHGGFNDMADEETPNLASFTTLSSRHAEIYQDLNTILCPAATSHRGCLTHSKFKEQRESWRQELLRSCHEEAQLPPDHCWQRDASKIGSIRFYVNSGRRLPSRSWHILGQHWQVSTQHRSYQRICMA